MHQLQASLDSTSELLKKVMETATATEAAAAEAKAAAQKEVDAMKAKLAEAAGVLNAKEELREARCARAAWYQLHNTTALVSRVSFYVSAVSRMSFDNRAAADH